VKTVVSYSAVVWSIIASVAAVSVLCAVNLKTRLGIVGWCISFGALAAVACLSTVAVEILYRFCFLNGWCSKQTGDEEYSVLLPLFYFPATWVVFIAVNYLKIAFHKKISA
jgi:hypothetical protein